MGVVLDSDDLPVADRLEVIHDAVCSGVLPVGIEWDDPARSIECRYRVATAGAVNISSAESTGNRLLRTARQARADHPAQVFLAVQLGGMSVVTQGEREACLRPGDMVAYDSTQPYRIINLGRTALAYFQVPRVALALPQRVVDDVLAVRIRAGTNPLAAVAAPYLRSLARSEVLDRPEAVLLADPTVELFRAVVTAQHGGAGAVVHPSGAPLVLSVQQYVRDHLQERDLGAASVAAAHHVSRRHLYATLARAGVSLHDTIRRQRLAACRRDLRDPRSAHLAVATIGARWGFVDPSHFGRVFKAAYGVTPYGWRAGDGAAPDPTGRT